MCLWAAGSGARTVDIVTDPMPMFPLGGVLVPSMLLPLHVFEERYRRLVRDCLDGTPEFGVVLIERGSEVGGGEARTLVGTVARLIEATEMPDGRFAVNTVGVRRIRIRQWLDDDPYPRADVEDWPDDPGAPLTELDAQRYAAVTRLRRALALQSEMGEPAPPATVELSDDAELASHQISALAPVGPHDRQGLLAAPSTALRLTEVAALLDDAIATFTARMEMG